MRTRLIAGSVTCLNQASSGVGDIPIDDVDVVPNPVITEEIYRQGERGPDHLWFESDVPVIVAVGRQTAQKEDEQTEMLDTLVGDLGIEDSVCFPGFVDNPYAYMRAADVFVLSSKWEGPGHVLIEALALGTPVVATDCPAGPKEILEDGNVGDLVPVGDQCDGKRDRRTA